MKFGKYLEARQVELAEYNTHFIDYKALKKLMKQLATVPMINDDDLNASKNLINVDIDFNEASVYRSLQANKASFFFKLERELEKVNLYYVDKESELKVKLDVIVSKMNDYRSSGRLNSKQAVVYKNISAVIKKFLKDVRNLEQYVELNRTGFAKVLKKWDKRSHSNEKEFYLATVVSVQPIFTRTEVARLSDEALNLLVDLNDLVEYSVGNGVNSPSTALGPGSSSNAVAISMDGGKNNSNNTKARRSSSSTGSEKGFFKVLGFSSTDLDLEIEYWIQDIINISTLKDDQRRLATISNFVPTKVLPRLEELLQNNEQKEQIEKECITKLFSLLIDSNLVDECLSVVYLACEQYIDFNHIDEDAEIFSNVNLFHEACACSTAPRSFLLYEALKFKNITSADLKNLMNMKDIHGRIPLHHAAEQGKTEFVELILESNLVDMLDIPDQDRKTPLILALESNDIKAVKLLLQHGSNAYPNAQDKVLDPLSVACKKGNFEAVKLILDFLGDKIEGPSLDKMELLHIVSKNSNSSALAELLISKGANVNYGDKFLGRTPLFYAVMNGKDNIVSLLLRCNASIDVMDDEGYTPLFYTIWESDVKVLNAMLPSIKSIKQKKIHSDLLQPKKLTLPNNDLLDLDSSSINDLTDSFENIPAFSLPPPIIPLRKYGHNFLEDKIYVKVIFKAGTESITLENDNDSLINAPGRIMLSSGSSDIIPRNVLFPVGGTSVTAVDDDLDEEGEIIFYPDTLENFSIQFDVFPTTGNRLIARTVTPPSFLLSSSMNGTNSLKIPLVDLKLSVIGTLSVEYQVIQPFSGTSLKVTECEPYWKSTNEEKEPQNSEPSKIDNGYITETSLCGSFETIKIYYLNDGRLVASKEMFVTVNGAKILLMDLTTEQLQAILQSSLFIDNEMINTSNDLKILLCKGVFDFKTLLDLIPSSIKLNIQICFPTAEEIVSIPVRPSPLIAVDKLINNLLEMIFSNERYLKSTTNHSRSLVFSSCCWEVCATLNWKQPIFPVFLKFDNLVSYVDPESSTECYKYDTAHHILDLVQNQEEYKKLIKKIDIFGMVKFAIKSHLLGLILPEKLLHICDTVVDSIRKKGLLVISFSDSPINEAEKELNANGVSDEDEIIFLKSGDDKNLML
ncbi:PHO81 [Nakaseomyces glabratus]|uniref:Phosphate system positive regulatory protein PHO81 n=2 Tax=Candida glabrata TaxID=5478 RepID=Q6FL30_CANGA|nr:uncharacterized protein CAGL0L06622g [Nakaseomyces glabratus]KAH7595546.1 Ankyrin repeats (3 copies) [Nakaseomyces glabratus]KAH7601978.1 Ankyrin repeats (3 copies) [Nakaseomyces glabratus]KAI8382731.1 Ankyrin repeats (3 copies) [Nakaseomyces glabratus]KAI8392843.1 Ankyrin repeats (3 copies) [Nakaseomyces glabratus]KAJ9571676.1 phosphate system positive regulatory protein pho81 [Nakaseomyces glabratus]|eukprot:XP_449064.1 uncharacterized protein CAGL0L06622g [[Candida] glabrata]